MAINLKVNIDPIMKLPMPKKLGILAGVNCVIVAAIFWFLILPSLEEVSRLRGEYASLTARLAESRAIASDIPKFLREKDEMEKRLAAAIAKLPNEKEIPDLIDSISSSGEKAGLKILLFKPGKEVPRGFYAEIPVDMTVEGRFESLYDFSVKVGNLPRIVNIGKIDVASEGHKNRIPVLKSSFVTTTFRFIPQGGEGAAAPAKAAPPATPGGK